MISIYTMGGLGVVATYEGQQSLIDRDAGVGFLVLREDAKVLAKLFNLGVMTLGRYPIVMMKLVGRFSVYETNGSTELVSPLEAVVPYLRS